MGNKIFEKSLVSEGTAAGLISSAKIGIPVILGMIATVVVLNVVFGPKEIDTWSRNVWVLKHKYIHLKPVGLSKPWVDAVKEAARRWNADLRDLGVRHDVFGMWVSKASLPGEGYVVRVGPAPALWYRDASRCGDREIRDGDKKSDGAGVMAEVVPRVSRSTTDRVVLESATIYLCVKKFESAIKLRRSYAARPLRHRGRLKILMHEPCHLFWHGHPKWVGNRCAAGALSLDHLSAGEKLLLKRYVIPQIVDRRRGD